MAKEEYKISDKQKMLGFALRARGFNAQNIFDVLMVLEDDDQIDDLTWYMGENPQAGAEQIIAAAYQIVKDAHEVK